MERGPLALFGAIVAVGVGPALWLGAQLGAVNLAPGQRPAPVDEQFPGVEMDFSGAGAGAGAGAGELPGDDEPFTPYTYTPLAPATSPSAVPRPSATTSATAIPWPSRPVPPSPPVTSAAPSPSTSDPAPPSTEPEPSASTAPEPSASPELPKLSPSPDLEPVANEE